MTDPRILQSALGFIEGPVWHDGELRLVSISRGSVVTLDADGTILRERQIGGGPNGLAVSGETMFVAQNGGIFGASGKAQAGIQVIRDDEVSTIGGHIFTAPNDLCFGPDGRLYVSDPLTDRALTEPVEGCVIACDPRTGASEVVIEGRHFPNGLAFDATGGSFYLAQTYERLVEKFAWRDVGLESQGVLCRLANGRPDGMAIDVEGHLWVCTPGTGGIEVFTREGAAVRRIDFGAGTMTTNCCFGGEDMRDMFVTAAGIGSVLTFRVDVPGLPLRQALPG